jgi:hypothetical protein
MFIITATFDPEAALARTSELLALGDSPERLAERLGISRDLENVRQGVQPTPFKRLLNEIVQLKNFVGLEKQIEEIKNDKTLLRFLGATYKEKQIARLEAERRKFGSLIEAPRWFYKQPRVQLLSAIRDYALDGAQQGDAAWVEIDETTLVFPIAVMFETADREFAEKLVAEIDKPLKDIDPRFVLEKFEGNRSVTFDFEKNVVLYYTPAPAH